jgi:drug/metabolite transporter (DMT)-like permease
LGVAVAAAWLWIVFTLVAAASQTVRNVLQRELTGTLGTIGATHVRFLFGLPFGVLFLVIVLTATGVPFKLPSPEAAAWTLVGALTQIAATALMLAAMQSRSIVVVTAYTKTEPILVAVFGLALLGDPVTIGVLSAILCATAGVLLMTWPKKDAAEFFSLRPTLLGVASAGLFGLSAVGFRGGITSVGSGSYIVDASTILVFGLLIQSLALSTWLALRSPETLRGIVAAWRKSLPAGLAGAFASQMWFLAFALESAARVRTLALVEIFFAQLLAGRLLREKAGPAEWLGIALVAAGVVLLLNS